MLLISVVRVPDRNLIVVNICVFRNTLEISNMKYWILIVLNGADMK